VSLVAVPDVEVAERRLVFSWRAAAATALRAFFLLALFAVLAFVGGGGNNTLFLGGLGWRG
jgi:hypothetical protein